MEEIVSMVKRWCVRESRRMEEMVSMRDGVHGKVGEMVSIGELGRWCLWGE